MAMVVPQIFANAVNEKLGVALRIGGRVAFDATDIVPDIRTCGGSVSFPSINRGVSAIEVGESPLSFASSSMNNTTAPVKQIACPARVLDKDDIQVKGGLMDKIIIQVVEAMQKKIDGDLVKEMDASAVYKTPTASATTITYDEIQSGMLNFGDDIDDASFAGIIINSRLVPSFKNMSHFTSTSSTITQNGNGIIVNGVVGTLGDIPVIVCNNETFDDSSLKECKTYIVKKDALAWVFQKDIDIKESYNIDYLATDIAATAMYAVKLLDKKGCVILRKTTT